MEQLKLAIGKGIISQTKFTNHLQAFHRPIRNNMKTYASKAGTQLPFIVSQASQYQFLVVKD
jgi:hypothetical protein